MLTEEQRKIGRRTFLKAAATLPVVGAFAWANRAKALHERPVQAGIIGAGSEGQVLLENAPMKAIEFRAVADIRPDSRERAAEVITTRWGNQAEMYGGDYHRLLEQDDIEAVLIATPPWKHAEMAIAALDAGKHVLVEKTMATSIADCKRMVQAARRNGRLLQVGHQRHSNRLYHTAWKMVREGKIGEVYHIRTLWHRNNDWRREVPDLAELRDLDPSFSPGKWGYGSLEELVNWRLYRKYSEGLMGELGSHQLDVVNWFTGTVPRRVTGTGGIFRWQDGRNVDDHVFVTFDYPAGPLTRTGLTVTFSSITSNKFDDYYEQFMGTKGTLILAGETQAMLFSEEEDEATAISVKKATTQGPVMEASASRTADASAGEATAVGTETGEPQMGRLEPYMREIEGFCAAIKFGTAVPCDCATALAAAVVVVAANEAIDSKAPRELADDLYVC